MYTLFLRTNHRLELRDGPPCFPQFCRGRSRPCESIQRTGEIKKSDLEFADFSVKEAFDSKDAEYIRSQIRSLIQRVSVTACLIGSETHTSRWVNWELKESNDRGKGLLGVRLYSNRQHVIPRALIDAAAEVVDWDIDAIVAAIERAARRAGY